MKICEILFYSQESGNGTPWIRDFHHKKFTKRKIFSAEKCGFRSAGLPVAFLWAWNPYE